MAGFGEFHWHSEFVDALDRDLKTGLGPATRATHFYVRGLLRNGGIFYASPVFVTVRQ